MYNESADIIIVNYNSLSFLKKCLTGIKKNTCYPYQVIIVDNASNDGSQSFLKKLKSTTVIFNTENRGCAAGWNQGITIGKGRYIILLNPDTLVTPNWLSHLVQTACSDEKIALVGTKQVNKKGAIIHAGVIKRNGRLINRTSPVDDPGVFDREIDLDRIYGACFLIKRELIPTLGLFDENIFLYGEETDYCLRIRKMGLRIRYSPVTIYHYNKGSRIAAARRKQLQQKSIDYLRRKWGDFLA